MAEVQWIKITVNMFDNRKIKHLRRLPDGDSIVLIWVMLLTMAGRCNAGGMIFLTENIPYTPKMLANELDFEESTVQLALKALEELDMVSTTDTGFLLIDGWEEHQNIDGLDKIREQTRKRVAKHRENQKLLSSCNVTSNVTETDGNGTDKEEDKEKELEIDNKNKKEESITCQQIVDLYNSICKSFPTVRSLSEARRKAIKARLKSYTLEDFQTVFQNAEASSFLKGSNDRNWSATFDWMMKDTNMAKILEGNYVDKAKRYGKKEIVPAWMERGLDSDEQAAIKRMFTENSQNTIGTDPDLAERAERLKQKLQEV